MVKLKIRKYPYLCIFRLTTSRSWKLIPKADLKWECTYFYSRFFFEEFWSVFQKVKKWISHCIFKKWFDRGRVSFLTKFFSEKAKLPEICLSFGGSMPEAQIWKVSDNPRLPSPPYLVLCVCSSDQGTTMWRSFANICHWRNDTTQHDTIKVLT